MGKRKGSPLSGNAGKQRKYALKFQVSWKDTFPWISSSSKGPTFIHCNVCSIAINISSGGKNDAQRHGTSNNHLTADRSRNGSKCVFHFNSYTLFSHSAGFDAPEAISRTYRPRDTNLLFNSYCLVGSISI